MFSIKLFVCIRITCFCFGILFVLVDICLYVIIWKMDVMDTDMDEVYFFDPPTSEVGPLYSNGVCVCARVCVFVFVYAGVHACVQAFVRKCARAYVRTCVRA